MSIEISPNIITNGLTMFYDINNLKSYIGKPVQNMNSGFGQAWGTVTVVGVSGIPTLVTRGGTDRVYIPSLGYKDVLYEEMINDYGGVYGGGGSGTCCPTLFGFGSVVCLPSTLYTYAIVYKTTNPYTNANYMYRYEYTANGGAYVTEAGVHSTANRIHLGDGWYWAWGTFTTQPTTNFLTGMALFHYLYYTVSRVYVAKVFLAQGDFTQVHPKYWPESSKAITNTTALKDLTGNTTSDLTNCSYDTSGLPYFNGVNYISIPHQSILNPNANSFTIQFWCKLDTSLAGWQLPIGKRYGAGYYVGIYNDNAGTIGANFMLYNDSGGRTDTSSIRLLPYTSNTWVMFTAILDREANTQTLVKNNYEDSVTQTPAGGMYSYSGNLYIGADMPNNTYFCKGQIPVVKIYNRALTPKEILQNYNALKSRYI